MPLPFDATVKDLAQANPEAFLSAFDTPPAAPVRLLSADLSTVTTAADLVFGIGDPLREVIHVEAQAGPNADLPLSALVYNALLHRRYRVPVHTIVLLLRPQAQHAQLSGLVRYEARPGRSRMEFGYEVVRLWERPVTPVLAGSLEMLPLAPLCQLPTEGLRHVLRQVLERLQREGSADQVKRLVTATYLLTGLRFSRDKAREEFLTMIDMRLSDTYQAILDEGRVEGMQKLLLRLGQERFGAASEAVRSTLTAIEDPDRLEALSVKLLKVSSWQELLETP